MFGGWFVDYLVWVLPIAVFSLCRLFLQPIHSRLVAQTVPFMQWTKAGSSVNQPQSLLARLKGACIPSISIPGVFASVIPTPLKTRKCQHSRAKTASVAFLPPGRPLNVNTFPPCGPLQDGDDGNHHLGHHRRLLGAAGQQPDLRLRIGSQRRGAVSYRVI